MTDFEKFYDDVDSLLHKNKLRNKYSDLYYDVDVIIDQYLELKDLKEEYDEVQSEYDDLKNSFDDLEEQNRDMEEVIEKLQNQIDEYRDILLKNNLSEYLL